jgi:hypothetical protein
MLDPTRAKKELDYRDFGDMFFDRNKDPLEVNNGINNPDYLEQIALLRGYYEEYVKQTPSTGKEEMIKNLLSATQ